MKRTSLLTLLVAVAAVIIVTTPILAFNGGAGVGDQQIGCAGTSKHTTGLATVTMGGGPMNPAAGQQVTVWVNVSGGATVGRLYGVMIISATSGTSTLPSSDGWTITQDPSGVATNNYVEKTATAGTNTFMWTLNAPASGSHTLYSKAYYSGGGSSSATVFTQGLAFSVGGVTPVPPTVAFNTPASSSTQSGTSMSVTATVTPGTSTFQSVTLSVNGQAITPAQTTISPSWTVDTTAYPNGSIPLVVSATTSAGTVTATKSVNFANPGPTVTISGPASGSTVSGTTTVTMTATPLAPSTIGSVTLRVDAGTAVTVPTPYTSYQLDTTGLTNSAHTMVVRATDSLGRVGTATIPFTVANPGPSVQITDPVAGGTVSGNITVNSTVTLGPTSSPITQVIFGVDGTTVQTKTASPYNFAFDTNAYANGIHSLMVRATDSNTNSGSQTISVTFANGIVVTTPPSVNLSYPTAGQTLTGPFSVNATVTAGTNAVNLVTLAVDGTVIANMTTGPFSFNLDPTLYVNGSHLINITAYDTIDLLGFQTLSATFGSAKVAAPSLGPLNIVTQTGSAQVSATITGPVSYVTISVDGSVVDNKTIAPYSFSIDTTKLKDGQHIIKVTATGAGGSTSKLANITVRTNLDQWEATIIGGSLLLIGGVAFMVASVLMLRRSKMRRMK